MGMIETSERSRSVLYIDFEQHYIIMSYCTGVLYQGISFEKFYVRHLGTLPKYDATQFIAFI